MGETRRIRVLMKDGRRFEGLVLPKTDYSSDDILIIKLNNGYNIGITEKNIVKKDYLKETTSMKKIKALHIKGKGPLISVIGTGGTISSRVDYVTGGVKASMSADEIIASVPEVANYAQIEFVEVMRKLSEDMTPKNWSEIAQSIYHALKKSEGAVVFHGTDTMHYTASAISFMIDTIKPIVFTGAQRSSDRPSTDAFVNALCSVHAAKSNIAESVICFHSETSDSINHIIRGNRARKIHTSARPAFKSINYPPLAKVWPDGKFEKTADYIERGDGKPRLRNKVEPKVALIKIFPGADPSILNWYASKGYKGIVLEGTGLGHVPVNPDNKKGWIPVIKELKDRIIFVATSQAINGRTHKNVYTNLRELSRLGVSFVGDMLPETAYTKLSWALGNFPKTEVKKTMETNLKGEMSERTLRI
ncbi:MAG: Glu-tRNA(Gln) amidotransferase subunit GatD [Candidatus Altiarchaeota archaeon]|nr:Glu-tRNA(Gln) amidotransferase subunit GatD [Candidatus Altiarchaeota archaeon]